MQGFRRIAPVVPTVRWLDAAIVVGTLLMGAVALSPSVADPDLWGHVQYGRDVLRDGLPATTTHSFTAIGAEWVNHENLAELLLAIAADSMGPVGMLVAKCGLGVGLIALILWNAKRRQVGILTASLVALLVAVNLTHFWTLRPQLLSFVCYGLMLAILSWCFEGWEGKCHLAWFAGPVAEIGATPLTWSALRMRCLWVLPVIIAVWTNAHGGFVAGWCILATYLMGRAVEAWIAKGRESVGLIVQLSAVIVISLAATLVNPYTWDLHRWLLSDLLPDRPEILEWRRPEMLSLTMLPFWLILVTFVAAILLSRRSKDTTHLVILALTAWQSFLHVRHIPFFAIAFGFWMAVHVGSVLQRFHIGTGVTVQLQGKARWATAGAILLAYALLGARLYCRLDQLTVDRKEYPVSAFQYIADRQLNGKMVVTFNWAQYALEALGAKQRGGPGMLVSFDGRYRTSYPQLIGDMNFDFILGPLEPRYRSPESPPFDDERVLEFGHPDLVLISRHQPHSVNVMFRNRANWTLLYQDKIAQLWGRSNIFADPQHPRYIAPSQRNISEAPQSGLVSWPAHPIRRQERARG